MQRFLGFFRIDDLPLMSRPGYLIELRYFLLWGILVGAVEGNLAGIVAKKTFDAPDWLASVIWALPISVNTLNLLWGVWLRGRRIIPTLALLTACAAVCIASVALTSRQWGALGAYVFAGQIALTHFFLSGLLSLRVAIWKANYPHTHRARITGRLQALRYLVIFAAGAGVSGLFDLDPDLYRFIYPAVALIGLAALAPISALRIRGERHAIAAYRARGAAGGRDGGVSRERGMLAGLREAVVILRQDRGFARYMGAQALLGSANFFTDSVLVTALVSQVGLGYYTTNLLMIQIPVALMLLSIPLWARHFDRVGVVRFRVRNSAMWLGSYGCISAAMLLVEHFGQVMWLIVTLLVAGRLINGVCRGGGSLAWTLGHLHFAGPHQAELYLGIHVALTGLRGVFVPLISAAANITFGNASFLLAIALAAAALAMFSRMARTERSPPLEESQPAAGS